MGLGDVAIEIGRELLEGLGISAHKDIAVLKTIRLRLLVELHTQRHVLDGYVSVAPVEENHRVDEQCQQEVDQHAANHNQQSLPGGFGAELPRLGRTLHLFGIEALINHACYLTVASQGNPPNAILRIAVLGLELKEAELIVEEEIELLDPYAKEFGEEEMATLVQQNKYRERQYQL